MWGVLKFSVSFSYGAHKKDLNVLGYERCCLSMESRMLTSEFKFLVSSTGLFSEEVSFLGGARRTSKDVYPHNSGQMACRLRLGV